MVEHAQATHEHAVRLAATMRQADVDEIAASEGMPPVLSVMTGIRHSVECKTLLIDGEVAAVYGVVVLPRVSPTTGIVWALTSTVVDRHPVTYVRESKRVLADLLTRYELLVNIVDGRYDRARRWAKRLGFHESEPEIIEPFGVPFYPICIRRK